MSCHFKIEGKRRVEERSGQSPEVGTSLHFLEAARNLGCLFLSAESRKLDSPLQSPKTRTVLSNMVAINHV